METSKLIETEYVARKEYELPVLRRFIRREKFTPERAQFIDVILYSKQQIDFEEKKLLETGKIDKIPTPGTIA
jgi:predicted nucleic-acid-binding protein